ncbi:Acetyltransferase (GNAT) family protein [Pseudooceanicola marinus]|uniref:Acetyltransferase (GNAT) family protein n=1 Tax=Pseudooceanicola marinus TaxID=396013 RepID=A0A1X6YD86_9RHOB|nr:GNAT family N-acetyltransferase [Pseudooceanicola marinus]PJE32981.1 GNAT family N-acetyltransferase [Pseudooceanicola marinus]SLN17213.1 Acetyltransferase (GNAT) family protein [Pseudooceanicola marinus]
MAASETLRRAGPEDAAALEAFLARYPETSMFLRSNLAAHGVGPGDHPHATEFLIFPAEGPLRAVFGRTSGGYTLVQCPGLEPEAFASAARAWAGQGFRALTGEAEMAARLLSALGLAGAVAHDNVEPLYRLALRDLPAGDEVIRPAQPGDEALLTDWFATYEAEIGTAHADAVQARADALSRARAAIAGFPMRLMLDNGQPVAMAAINARVGDVVQVGGVFVPPEARNQGLGRRVTRALLQEEAQADTRLAVLFANNAAAARAYEALGFVRVGDYRVALADRLLTIPGEGPA